MKDCLKKTDSTKNDPGVYPLASGYAVCTIYTHTASLPCYTHTHSQWSYSVHLHTHALFPSPVTHPHAYSFCFFFFPGQPELYRETLSRKTTTTKNQNNNNNKRASKTQNPNTPNTKNPRHTVTEPQGTGPHRGSWMCQMESMVGGEQRPGLPSQCFSYP